MPPAFPLLFLGNFVEVIRAGIVLVNQSSIAIKEIRKYIIVMDNQMEDIIRKTLCDVDRDSIGLFTLTGENADPPIDRRPDQKFAIDFFRDTLKGLLNGRRVFSSDMD